VEFRFFSDESYDPPKTKRIKGAPPSEPMCYIVGGFIADQRTWEKIEKGWVNKNKRVGVPRYHAAHLNAGTWEFDGWSKGRRLRYSKDLLRILKRQKARLHGLSCGIFVDAYRRIISSEGQEKMGHPYLVCLKTCIATLALHMEYGGFAPEDTFSVVIDRSPLETDAVRTFYAMKDDPNFAYRHRLEACIFGASETLAGLQVADFIAYESFRLMQGKRNGVAEMRRALNGMLDSTGFLGYMFDDETLERNKDGVEATPCKPGGCVILPTYEWERRDSRAPRTK
jgi:hypothetical protein